MSSIDDIYTDDEFNAVMDNQWAELFTEIDRAQSGSDELSALMKACINDCILERLDTMVGPLMERWLVLRKLRTDPNTFEQHMRTINMPLYPSFSTSMDAKLPGENIVMLAKQHRPPGVVGERWAALQEGAKVSYMGNTAVLACRINALRAIHPEV